MAHLDRLILHIDVPLLRQVSIFAQGNLHNPSLFEIGAVLGEAAEERCDVSLALGLVHGSTRGDDLESLLPGLRVHLPQHVTRAGALGCTTLHGADGEGDGVEVVRVHFLHGTLGRLLEGSLDAVDLLFTLLDEERTTVRLENHASLRVHEVGSSRHFVILFTEIFSCETSLPFPYFGWPSQFVHRH